MRWIVSKFRNIIKQGYIKISGDDSKTIPIIDYGSAGRDGKCAVISVFGIVSNPTKGSHLLLFNSQSRESSKFGIANDFKNRVKNLPEGAIGLNNPKTGTLLLLDGDGNVTIENAGKVKINNGDIEVTNGDIIADGISLKTHKTSLVEPGTGQSGVPIP